MNNSYIYSQGKTSLQNTIMQTLHEIFDMDLISGVVVTGSVLKNYVESHDIDILLVSDSNKSVCTHIIDGYAKRLHIIILPSCNLIKLLLHDILKGEFVYHSMIKDGVILKDEKAILWSIKHKYLSSKNPFNARLLGRWISSVHEQVDRVEEVGILAFSQALNVILTLERLLIHKYSPSDKYVDAEMSERPFERMLLANILRDFINTGNGEEFAQKIRNMITMLGNMSPYIVGSSLRLHDVYEDELIVFLPETHISHGDVIYLIQVIESYDVSRIYNVMYVDRLQPFEHGTYIIIYGKREEMCQLRKDISQEIEFSRSGFCHEIYLPYNSYLTYINLYGLRCKSEIIKMFYLVTKYYFKSCVYCQKRAIQVALKFTYKIIELCLPDNYEILLHIVDRFVVESASTYDCLSSSHEILKTRKYLQRCNEQCDEQIEMVLRTMNDDELSQEYVLLENEFASIISQLTSYNDPVYNSVTYNCPQHEALINFYSNILSSLGFRDNQKYSIIYLSIHTYKCSNL